MRVVRAVRAVRSVSKLIVEAGGFDKIQWYRRYRRDSVVVVVVPMSSSLSSQVVVLGIANCRVQAWRC